MSIDTWTLYVGTVLALMSTPGPSHLLMLSNSATHGYRRALATAAGDLTANTLQMLAAGLGLAALLASYGHALALVKWAGAAYLVGLGIVKIRNAGSASRVASEPRRSSLKTLWLQGFVTSASNPKAIVFFAALFPQFIGAAQPFWSQFAILAGTYVLIDGVFLTAYGIGTQSLARRIGGSAHPWTDKLGGGLMLAAGVALGLKTLKES